MALAMWVSTALVAILSARDSLWKTERPIACLLSAAWLLLPSGVFAREQFIGTDTSGLELYVVACLIAIIVGPGGRPALMMTDAWPESAAEDESLRALAHRRTWIAIGLVCATTAALAIFG